MVDEKIKEGWDIGVRPCAQVDECYCPRANRTEPVACEGDN